MNKIFSKGTIFKQIDHEETLKKLKQFQGFLYKLRKNKYLDEEAYQSINQQQQLYLRPTQTSQRKYPMRSIRAS